MRVSLYAVSLPVSVTQSTVYNIVTILYMYHNFELYGHSKGYISQGCINVCYVYSIKKTLIRDAAVVNDHDV